MLAERQSGQRLESGVEVFAFGTPHEVVDETSSIGPRTQVRIAHGGVEPKAAQLAEKLLGDLQRLQDACVVTARVRLCARFT